MPEASVDPYSMEAIVRGIADDLIALRKGEISVSDANARATLAKQYMNGVRLLLVARQSIEQTAKPTKGISHKQDKTP